MRRPRRCGGSPRRARQEWKNVVAGTAEHADAADPEGLPRNRVVPEMTPSPEVQRRVYALMALMKAADDRLSRGIGTGEFMCVYWPSRGQEAIAAAMGVTLRDDDQLVTTYRGLHDLI